MRWWFLILICLLTLALDLGLRSLWMIPLGPGITPNLVLILMVFISLWATPLRAMWIALALGLALDLLHPWPLQGSVEDLVVLGPMALGFAAGCYLILQLRSFLFRDSLISLAALVFLAGGFAHLLTLTLLILRTLPWLHPLFGGHRFPPAWSAADQLWQSFLSLLYSSLLALPLGWLLLRTLPFWSFDTPTPRSPVR